MGVAALRSNRSGGSGVAHRCALMKTWLLVPIRNTGGARVSGFHADPVPPDLQRLIDFAFGLR
jgi:hypothetical protein